MNDSHLLEARLQRLERSHRRLRLLCTALGLGLFGVVLMGQAKPQAPANPITTSRLALVDSEGREAAVLGNSREGPTFSLNDQEGRRRALLAVNGSGVLVHLNGEDQKPRMSLSVLADESRIVAREGEGGSVALLGTFGGDARLQLQEPRSKAHVFGQTTTKGDARLDVIDGTAPAPE